ncbi:MAG: hypothetical protein WBB36_07515, partial [Chitinophagales bacterium]
MKPWTYSLIGFVLIVSLAMFMNFVAADSTAHELVVETMFTAFICGATWGGSMFVDRFICGKLINWSDAPIKRLLLSYLLSGMYA